MTDESFKFYCKYYIINEQDGCNILLNMNITMQILINLQEVIQRACTHRMVLNKIKKEKKEKKREF